jgi:membrane-associated phospholipid phosphatase
MFPWSPGLDVAGDLVQALAIAAPLLVVLPLAFGGGPETPPFGAPRTALLREQPWLDTTVMYAEAAALAFGVRELAKQTVHRERPYTYFEGPPDDAFANGDYHKSFFSGHTVMAFTGAVFTGTVFQAQHPESPWRHAVWAGGLALATGTAALRIAGGSHFLSDVAVGVAVGTLCGWGIPQLNRLARKNRNAPLLAITPGGVFVRVAGGR